MPFYKHKIYIYIYIYIYICIYEKSYGQVCRPILGICALHLTHPNCTHRAVNTHTHCEHTPGAVGSHLCCGAREEVGVNQIINISIVSKPKKLQANGVPLSSCHETSRRFLRYGNFFPSTFPEVLLAHASQMTGQLSQSMQIRRARDSINAMLATIISESFTSP